MRPNYTMRFLSSSWWFLLRAKSAGNSFRFPFKVRLDRINLLGIRLYSFVAVVHHSRRSKISMALILAKCTLFACSNDTRPSSVYRPPTLYVDRGRWWWLPASLEIEKKVVLMALKVHCIYSPCSCRYDH